MKKYLSKIIILMTVVAIFVVPFSLDFKKQTVLAQYENWKNILPNSSVKWISSSQSVAEFSVNIKGPQTDWDKAYFVNVDSLTGQVGPAPKTTVLVIMENGKYINYYDFSTDISKVTTSSYSFLSWTALKPQIDDQYIAFSIGGLTAGKTYTAELYYVSKGGEGGGIDLFESTNKNFYKFGKSTSFDTPNPSPDDVGGVITGDFPVLPTGNNTYTPAAKFDCSVLPTFNIKGCIAQVFYALSEVTSWVARLAGSFLDFFVYYSTNSSSYSNLFVEKGWSAIRDVANIFFIVALLFIAIKTILNLNVTNNKKLLGTIVMIALIINFSLFTTKVVIDGSNILAKIFYNNISSKDVEKPNAEGSVTGQAGEKSLSIGLVDKFNPQQLLMTIYDNGNGLGLFIFVILLLMAITLYTAYIFFSIALLFVARVVQLWISMIFSPIAFVSYTLPFEIPGFGHKEWWNTLFKTAFMAPLFIFMLYIIILFAGFLGTIASYADSPNLSGTENIAQHLMSIIIPFIILMMLLRMSKKLAVEYSGEMGKAIMTGAKMIGGVALGAATGGVAMIGRSTLGAGSSLLLRSGLGEKLKTKSDEKGLGGFAARTALKGTTSFTKASFDARKTALGGGLSKVTGMNFESAKAIGLGSKTGGFAGIIEKRNKETMEEFETHKTKMTDAEVETWNAKNNEKGKGIHGSDGKLITKAEQLNNYRMNKFNENIGKTGPVYSLAYSMAKASLGKEAKEEDIEKRTKTIKLVIGGTLAVAGGALGAGIGATAFGTLGGIAGGAIGAGTVPVEAAKLEETERLTRATMKKQIDTLKNLETRIKDLTEAEKNQHSFLENGNNISKDSSGNPIKFVEGDKDQGFKVDQDKLEDVLAKLAINEKEKDARLTELAKNGLPVPEELKEELKKNTLEMAKLNKLKTAIKDLNTIQNQLYNVKKDKTAATTPAKKDDNSSGSKPNTPPVASTSTPSHK